jgi:hypothetical protein
MGYTRDKNDNLYHIKGNTYHEIRGSRQKVLNGTAYMTTGELTKDKLLLNKNGYIVSKKKHITATKEMRLEKYGYFTKKGKFGYIRKKTMRKKH